MKPRFAAVWMLAPLWTSLSEKARSVESDPCKIVPTFTEESDGVRLDVDFVFACEAEMLIFQLGLR